MRRVVVSDKDGNEYDMVTSLCTYLVNHKSRSFEFGDWLQSLSNGELNRLIRLNEASQSGSNDALAHIIQITAVAMCAELQERSVTLNEEVLLSVVVLACVESYRRKGLMIVHSPLRLSSDKIHYSITDEGMAADVKLSAAILWH